MELHPRYRFRRTRSAVAWYSKARFWGAPMIRRCLVAAALLTGCSPDQPPVQQKAPPKSVKPAAITPLPGDQFAIGPAVEDVAAPASEKPDLVDRGEACVFGKGERLLQSDEAGCMTVLLATRHVVDPAKPDVKIGQLRLAYKQPGPIGRSGKPAGWLVSDVQVNCSNSEMAILKIRIYDVDGAVIEEQGPLAGRSADANSHAVVGICR